MQYPNITSEEHMYTPNKTGEFEFLLFQLTTAQCKIRP